MRREVKRVRTRMLRVGLLLTLGGCAAGSQAAEGDQDLLASDEMNQELSLEVKNLNFYDAELYLLDHSHRVRLGFVAGNKTETFSFRWPPSRNLQVVIHLISVGTYLSETLPVEEGDLLELIIEPDLHRERPDRVRPSE